MKLKKIASLMLAGIMAVSMLAACGEGKKDDSSSSSSEVTAASNFTETVLAETSEATRKVLKASADDTLDEALAYAARNNTYGTFYNDLTVVPTSSALLKDAQPIMGTDGTKISYSGKDVLFSSDNWDFSGASKDYTYWIMYVVSSDKTDEWVASKIADGIDGISDTMNGVDGFEFSVRVAKADLKASTGSDIADSTLVGVAVIIDDLSNNH